jgi:hypothetical protein
MTPEEMGRLETEAKRAVDDLSQTQRELLGLLLKLSIAYGMAEDLELLALRDVFAALLRVHDSYVPDKEVK